jgi:general secretion pathway protein I
VAFSILALSLGVLMQIFSSGIRNAQVSAAYSQAADLAESLLARAGVDLPLALGVQSDNEQGYQWDLEVVPYPIPDLIAPVQGVEPYQVTARVTWSNSGGTHSLELHTLRLALSS